MTADPGGVSVAAPSSPHTITLQPGVYSIHVMSFPQDLSSEALAVELTVRGEKNNWESCNSAFELLEVG